MKTKNLNFDTFYKFIYQAKCQFEKKLKHLYIKFREKFDNKAFKEYTANQNIKWKSNASYILKQNRKVECLNYTLMFLVQLILAAMHLLKTL